MIIIVYITLKTCRLVGGLCSLVCLGYIYMIIIEQSLYRVFIRTRHEEILTTSFGSVQSSH
jgi:hypothetical protein